jgi:hypothetical protein
MYYLRDDGSAMNKIATQAIASASTCGWDRKGMVAFVLFLGLFSDIRRAIMISLEVI